MQKSAVCTEQMGESRHATAEDYPSEDSLGSADEASLAESCTQLAVAPEDDRVSQPTHRARILFVDDDPGLRRSLGRELRAAGYYVDIAASGGEAVDYVDQNTYDVVLSDIRMPEMDGIQLLTTCRCRSYS